MNQPAIISYCGFLESLQDFIKCLAPSSWFIVIRELWVQVETH